MIQVESVTKSFGAKRALDGVTFTVGDGEVVTLVAANGGGKTTCFRVVAGLVEPDSGQACIDGTVQTSGSRRVPVGFGSDQRTIYHGRRPRDVLLDYARLAGMGKDEGRARVEDIARRLDMTAFAAAKAHKPSTGEAMKMTLARVLLSGCRNVVLDEPTGGLDFASTGTMQAIIRELRGQGCAILLSSHRADEIERVSDRIVLMSAGRVVLQATPAEIRAAAPDGTMLTGIIGHARELAA